MRLRQRAPHEIGQEGDFRGNLLQMSPFLYREAEIDRRGRSSGALPEEVRFEEPKVGLTGKGAKDSWIQGFEKKSPDSIP